MSLRLGALVLALGVSFASVASAQTSGPAATPPIGNMYTPVFGGTAGIAIPIGALADDHGAGYTLGGLVEWAVSGQPYALRGELLYQRFNAKDGHPVSDVNLTSLGATFVYKLQPTPTNTFLTGGIAIYNATHEGTRPGANIGTGIEIPLTGFSATGEARLHIMFADKHPIITLPLTVGIRF